MSCQQFVAESFAVRTAAHVAHLLEGSYARHKALDEFYSALVDLVDRYAEVAMGEDGRFKSIPAATVPTGDIVGILEEYHSVVRDEIAEDEGPAKVNVLTDIEELTLRTLYKLKNLK